MPQLEEVWTIPITVRQHGTTTVIYIDKPLPPTSMTTEDKTNLRCKRGVKFVLQKPWANQKMGKKQAPKKKNFNKNNKKVEIFPAPIEPAQVSGGLFDDTIDLSVLETFGDATSMQQVLLGLHEAFLLK